MPSKIPVRISERDFPSLNQARLHYVSILRKYLPGQAVDQGDGKQVSELLTNCTTAHPPEHVHEFRVVHGNYGRICFANVDAEKNTRLISIMRSVKSFVGPAALVAKMPQMPDQVAKSSAEIQQGLTKELKAEGITPRQEVQTDDQGHSAHNLPKEGALPADVASAPRTQKSSKVSVMKKPHHLPTHAAR